ncbi:MAG: hypothetical protein VW981_01285, partial [Rhodobiaceae bacterium]
CMFMLGPYINAEQIYSRPLSAHDNSKNLICKKERERAYWPLSVAAVRLMNGMRVLSDILSDIVVGAPLRSADQAVKPITAIYRLTATKNFTTQPQTFFGYRKAGIALSIDCAQIIGSLSIGRLLVGSMPLVGCNLSLICKVSAANLHICEFADIYLHL